LLPQTPIYKLRLFAFRDYLKTNFYIKINKNINFIIVFFDIEKRIFKKKLLTLLISISKFILITPIKNFKKE
tara:strand:+ start:623 stop:838 length:216 start_codon:yes stop_codon:yes gene_type:complete